MAILIANDGDKIVNTIAERDAIIKKFDGMEVTVKDAIADLMVGGGRAGYQWDTGAQVWKLVWKHNKDDLVFVTENLPISNGLVTLTNSPQSALVWDSFVTDAAGNMLVKLSNPTVTGKSVSLGSAEYNGETLWVSYAYGKIQAAVSATAITKVTSTDNALVRFNGTTGDVQDSLVTVDDNGTVSGITLASPNFTGAVTLPTNVISVTASQYPTIRPTLDLDFANSGTVDPRITFARATTATYYDGKTTVMAEQNLFLQSQFVASWAPFNSTLTANSVVAPDGATTAATLIPTAVSGAHGVTQSAGVIGNQYTYSVYGKSNGYTNLQLYADSSGNFNATFDLTAGTAASTGGATVSIVSIGSGWYRCIATFTQASNTRLNVQGFPTGATASNFGNIFTGDGTSGIYLWGAQLEQRSSVTAYTPTTTAPITNYIPKLMTAPSGVPRLDHNPVTGQALGLLIEEQRTNVFLNSDVPVTQSYTTTAIAYTISFYGTGTIVLSGAYVGTITGTSSIVRTILTFTSTAASLTMTVSGTMTKAQLEAGAFATSYIPTTSAQVTRNADLASMTGTNFSSWYNQAQGALYCNMDYLLNADNVGGRYWSLTGSSGRFVDLYTVSGSLQLYNSIPTLCSLFPVATKAYNTIFSYNISALTGIFAGNGTISQFNPGTTASYPPSTLWLGSYNGGSLGTALNGHIRKLTYYPQALSSANLIALTS